MLKNLDLDYFLICKLFVTFAKSAERQYFKLLKHKAVVCEH